MNKGRAKQLRAVIEQAMSKEEDTVVLENPNLLPVWQPGVDYVTGRKLVHENVVYKVLQDHTSQYGWEPGIAPSLFAVVLIPDPEVIPVWEQPDSTNPYMTGDKVHFPTENDPVYESLIDGNVWSPEAYPQGWKIVE